MQISEFSRRDAYAFLENIAEIRRRAISERLTYLIYRKKSVLKELLCGFYAYFVAVIQGSYSCYLLENTGKMIFAHTTHGGIILKAQIAFAIYLHVRNGVGYAPQLLVRRIVKLCRLSLYY